MTDATRSPLAERCPRCRDVIEECGGCEDDLLACGHHRSCAEADGCRRCNAPHELPVQLPASRQYQDTGIRIVPTIAWHAECAACGTNLTDQSHGGERAGWVDISGAEIDADEAVRYDPECDCGAWLGRPEDREADA